MEQDTMLTRKQQKLVTILEYRSRYGLPTVQRDLAESLGIRRDSLNKLLARTRRSLQRNGGSLPLPPRSGGSAIAVVSFANSA
jgi:CRP-like cAMP-binding protein